MRKLRQKFLNRWLLLVLACLAPIPAAWAASVPISSMLVNDASLTINITGDGTYTFSGPVIPPADIVMGTYQNPIYTANVATSGITGTATFYSTSAYGEPAPSGFVDSSNATNPVNVDFSSFRLNVNITSPFSLAFDAPAWPLTTPNSSSTFNSGTNAYSLTWLNNFSVTSTGGTPITGSASVTLSGTLTPVPVPAALPLFGSALIGLAGLGRRRKFSA